MIDDIAHLIFPVNLSIFGLPNKEERVTGLRNITGLPIMHSSPVYVLLTSSQLPCLSRTL